MGDKSSISVGMTNAQVLRYAKKVGVSKEVQKNLKAVLKMDGNTTISNPLEARVVNGLIKGQKITIVPAHEPFGYRALGDYYRVAQELYPDGTWTNTTKNNATDKTISSATLYKDGEKYYQITDADGDNKADSYRVWSFGKDNGNNAEWKF